MCFREDMAWVSVVKVPGLCSGSWALSGQVAFPSLVPHSPKPTTFSSLGTSKGRESSGGTVGRRGVPIGCHHCLLTWLSLAGRRSPGPGHTSVPTQAQHLPAPTHSPVCAATLRGVVIPKPRVARKPTDGDGIRPLNLGALSGQDKVWRSVREGLRSGRAEGRWRRSPARAQSLRFPARCGSAASEEGPLTQCSSIAAWPGAPDPSPKFGYEECVSVGGDREGPGREGGKTGDRRVGWVSEGWLGQEQGFGSPVMAAHCRGGAGPPVSACWWVGVLVGSECQFPAGCQGAVARWSSGKGREKENRA